jgi:hypothetical protein
VNWWQPIDTAPKDAMAPLLLWAHKLGDDEDHVTIGYWVKPTHTITSGGETWTGWLTTKGDEDYEITPTHWMSLPSPP